MGVDSCRFPLTPGVNKPLMFLYKSIYCIVSNRAPPLIVALFIFSTKKYVMICTKLILSHLKQHYFINGTWNIQFYNVIRCFLWYLPHFYPRYEFKFNVLVFLIMAPPQKLVLAPGATIRDNTVHCIVSNCGSLSNCGPPYF